MSDLKGSITKELEILQQASLSTLTETEHLGSLCQDSGRR